MPSKQDIKLSTAHQIYIDRHGKGEQVLLLHGLLGSHAYWDEVVKHIPTSKYEVIAPDLLGFGRSDKPKDISYGIDDHVAAIERAVFDNIKTPVTLVGHSMGAMVALRLAAKYPDRVKSLVLVNLPLFPDSKQAGRIVKKALRPLQRVYVSPAGIVLYGMRNNVLKTFITQSVQGTGSELPDNVVADYYKHNWQSFKRSLVNTVFNHSTHEDLASVTTKTKFIYSEDDPFLNPAALAMIDALSHFDRIELEGQHRLPIAQARRIAFEICN
jgi:pimeloyl-ACP methyl ester carboxylesterase